MCSSCNELINFLIEQNVIHDNMNCIKYGNAMKFHRDSLMYRCHKVPPDQM